MTEKKRFRKAMSQLDSAFQKANEVNIPTKINKFVKKTEQEKRVALDCEYTYRTQTTFFFKNFCFQFKKEIHHFYAMESQILSIKIDFLKQEF